MPRKARMVVKGESAVYHVMSRTALEGFVLGDIEKDYLLQLIKHFSSIYFTEILGYCLMGNHFHVVVRIHPSERYSDDDISERFTRYYQNDKTKTSPLCNQRSKNQQNQRIKTRTNSAAQTSAYQEIPTTDFLRPIPAIF
jgi:REP element-mobilizing transposase RayT